MTSIPLRQQSGQAIAPAMTYKERLGVVYPLLLVWIFFEYGRPPNPMKIPLAISTICLLAWLAKSEKQWTKASPWWLVLLGGAGIGIPFSANTYASFWTTWDMGIRFLSICLPLQAFLTSVHRIRLWFLVFLAVALYVGAWAVTHGGYGPSGAHGGQDENYVAAHMGAAIAVAYFALFAEKGITKLVLAGSMIVFVGGIALGFNPSRGGFIGLVAVALYCLWRSPRKMLGIAVFSVIAVALLALAGSSFWGEIGTSTDRSSGTGDVRIEIWKAGLRMFQANPILGVGAGNFRWVIGEFQTAEQLVKFGRSLAGSIIAHSLWVEMLAELGLVGVTATGALVWRTWTDLGRIRDETMKLTAGLSPDPELVRFRCYADAIRAAIVAVLVNGLFLSLFYFAHLWLFLALGGALTFLYRSRQAGPVPRTTTTPPLPGPVRLAASRRGGLALPALPRSQVSRAPRRGRR